MAHFIVDPGSTPDLGPQLRLWIDTIEYLEYPLITIQRGGFTRNVRAYQAPESSQQVVAGDGKPALGERTVDILVEGATSAEAHERLAELVQFAEDRHNVTTRVTYGGGTWYWAGIRGVTSVQPVGAGTTLRVTLAYYPETQFGVRPGSVPIAGPL